MELHQKDAENPQNRSSLLSLQRKYSDKDVMENIFKFGEMLNFYKIKIKQGDWYSVQDEISWPMVNQAADKAKLQDKEMKMSVFVSLFKYGHEITMQVVYPVKDHLKQQLNSQ